MSILVSPDRWMIRVAFVLGTAAAIALVVTSRVPATPVGRGLEVSIATNLTGELDVSPYGTFGRNPALVSVRGRNLARGRTVLTNQTPKPLSLQLRSRPALRELDEDVRVAVDVGHAELVNTTLGRFRRWVGWNIVLPPGRPVPLVVRVRLSRGLPRATYAGRVLDLPLELRTEVVQK